MREESPAKYLELATKLLPLVAAVNPGASDYSQCKSMEDIGRRLLKSVGLDEDFWTADAITAAIEANDRFIARLEEIRDNAQGGLS